MSFVREMILGFFREALERWASEHPWPPGGIMGPNDPLNRWAELEPEIRRIFIVDYLHVDFHRRKLSLVTWGTVRLDMLQELARLTGSDRIEVIATDRTSEREDARKAEQKRAAADGEEPGDPDGDMFEEGLLIQVFEKRP